MTIAADYDPLVMSENDTPDTSASDTESSEPGELLFSVLRRDEEEPSGPFTQEDVLRMLQNGELERQDFVYHDGMLEWQPIDQIFDIQEQISHFVDDGQDHGKVAEVFREISELLAAGEDIYYIAVQEKTGLLSKAKACVILTNKRLFVLHEKRGGFELESHQWTAVSNTLMKDEGKGMATFSVLLGYEKRLDVPHLPNAQVHRLFQLSQELREM